MENSITSSEHDSRLGTGAFTSQVTSEYALQDSGDFGTKSLLMLEELAGGLLNLRILTSSYTH